MTPQAVATVLASFVSAAALVFVALQANSLNRQLNTQLSQGVQKQRLIAYRGLWAATEKASGMRGEGHWAGGPLSENERRELFDALTRWYYGDSGGIFLYPKTRALYLKVKRNLLCPDNNIEPKEALKELMKKFPNMPISEQRSQLAIRQISLLRWVMRFDLSIETPPYFSKLLPAEKQLLESCRIEADKPPFKGHWGLEGSSDAP
jgi:hypothetical protein